MKMVEFPTYKGSWPWPWPVSYCTPSCITHLPLPTYQISFEIEGKFLWTNGRTYGLADGHLRPTNVIRSTQRSRPNN